MTFCHLHPKTSSLEVNVSRFDELQTKHTWCKNVQDCKALFSHFIYLEKKKKRERENANATYTDER